MENVYQNLSPISEQKMYKILKRFEYIYSNEIKATIQYGGKLMPSFHELYGCKK